MIGPTVTVQAPFFIQKVYISPFAKASIGLDWGKFTELSSSNKIDTGLPSFISGFEGGIHAGYDFDMPVNILLGVSYKYINQMNKNLVDENLGKNAVSLSAILAF